MSIENDYLTINQVAAACSISRASILRMEKDGILFPAYVDSNNGYRYYDQKGVLRIIRNITLKKLGFTHKELKAYYDSPDNYSNMLEELQSKLALAENYLSNLRTYLKLEPPLEAEYFQFPEVYCYTEVLHDIKDTTLVRPHIWKAFNEAVLKGYSIDIRMNPFVLVDFKKMEMNGFGDGAYDYVICIAVMPNDNDPALKHFSKTNTLSSIIYGGSEDITRVFKMLSEEIHRQKINCDDYARVIAVINSYPGEEIPKEYWAIRTCIPVDEPK